MFRILGADGREYGPVTADVIRQWIAERRADAQSKVLRDGETAWQSLSSCPEFADALAAQNEKAAPPVFPDLSQSDGFAQGSELPPDVCERDYDLSIGDCFERAWKLLTGPKMWLVIGGGAICIVIQAIIGALGSIPIIGPAFSILNLVITPAMMGGLYIFLLRCLREQPVEIENIFDGFRYRFIHLFLGYLIMSLLLFASVIPGLLLLGVGIIPIAFGNLAVWFGLPFVIAGILAILIPSIYLTVCWMFSLPLIADKGLDFWPAMQMSRKVVHKHWGSVFLLVILAGLMNLVGVLLCCVGTFFTFPLVLAATMAAYEVLFGVRKNQAYT